jgi:hypothetical protein
MRLLISLSLALCACTAVDNFSQFKFVDASSDHDMVNHPKFGEACTVNDCASPTSTLPLVCFTHFGTKAVPSGMCTRLCSLASLTACADVNGECVTIENMNICLPRCRGSLTDCRPGYACCANHMVVTGPGECAPTDTDLCM